MHVYIYIYILLSHKNVFLNLQKNRSQKLSMQEEKQRQFWNLHLIWHKVTQNDWA